MATRFSGGGSRSTRREPPTLGKQLVSFITCGCESSAPLLFNLQSELEKRFRNRFYREMKEIIVMEFTSYTD
jgi:hypothetical protein